MIAVYGATVSTYIIGQFFNLMVKDLLNDCMPTVFCLSDRIGSGLFLF
ncbi:hypothetical protein [Runella sp.]